MKRSSLLIFLLVLALVAAQNSTNTTEINQTNNHSVVINTSNSTELPLVITLNVTGSVVEQEISIDLVGANTINTTNTLLEVVTPSGRFRLLDAAGQITFPLIFTPIDIGLHTFQLVDRVLRTILVQVDVAVTQNPEFVFPEQNETEQNTTLPIEEKPLFVVQNETNTTTQNETHIVENETTNTSSLILKGKDKPFRTHMRSRKTGEEQFADITMGELAEKAGVHDIELFFHGKTKKVVLENYVLPQEAVLGIEDLQVNPTIQGSTAVSSFALDFEGVTFTEGVVTREATGQKLWKCAAWDFDNQQCLGTWVFVKDIEPGTEYNITINATDPGYAETVLTIINVQSYPVVGGTWQVRFNTTGTADLLIRAGNETTWTNDDDGTDLRLLEIACEGQPQQYQWVNNSAFIANYSCNGTSSETSRVLTEGVHNLEFYYGDSVGFAHNDASGDSYFYNESEGTSTTTSTSPVNKTVLAFTIGTTSNYTILASAELAGDAVDSDITALLIVDGAVEANYTSEPDEVDIFHNYFAAHKTTEFASGAHTIELQFLTESGQTASIRRARIAVIKTRNVLFNETNTETAAATTGTEIVNLTFTVDEAGEYLLIGSAEAEAANTGFSVTTRTLFDGGTMAETLFESQDLQDYKPHFTANVTNLTAGTHSFVVIGQAETGTMNIRRARVTAVPIANNFDYFIVQNESETTNPAATPVNKSLLTFTPTVEDDYLVLSTAILGGDAGNGAAFNTFTETFVDTTQIGGAQFGLQDDTDRHSPFTLRNFSFDASQHEVYRQHSSGASSAPAGSLRSSRIIILRTVGSLPSGPTNIQCDGSDNCDIHAPFTVDLNASGAIDTGGDPLTYFIEASLNNITTVIDTTDVNKRGTATLGTLRGISYEDFEVGFTTWTNTGGDDNDCWTRDSGGTPSGGTGPSVGAESTTFYIYYEASTGGTSCPTSAGETSFLLGPSIDFNTNNSVSIEFFYHQFGTALGNVSLELEDEGGGGFSTVLFNRQGPSQDTWFSDTIDLSAHDHTGTRALRFVETGDTGFSADSAVDQINISGQENLGPANDTNTTYTEHTDLDGAYINISNITIKVEVDSYNPETSANVTTTKPDLELEIYNGSAYVSLGLLNLTEAYPSNTTNTTNVNFTKLVTNVTILTAWRTVTNQDIRIRGRFIDYLNHTFFDEINYTTVEIKIDGRKWVGIGNHSETTNLTWNTTAVPEQECINLRTRSIDLNGSAMFSEYFTKNSCLNITRNPEAFNLLTPANDTESSNLQPTFTWEQVVEENFDNYTVLIDKDVAFGSPDFIYHNFNTVTNTTRVADSALDTSSTYHWRVVAYDIFGLSTNATNDFFYITDTTAPSVTLNMPSNDSFSITNLVVYNYTPSETNTLVNCTLFGNFSGSWEANQTNISPTKGQSNFFNTTLNDGTYGWNVQCIDLAGNVGFAANNYTIHVDTTPPNVSLEGPANNTLETVTNNIVFSYNVTDIATDIASCELIIDNDVKDTDTTITEETSQNFTAFVANGQHNWSINCTDGNGFEGASVTYNLSVDVIFETDPPVIILNFPIENQILPTVNISFNYTPSDASGIANCSIFINNTLNQTNMTPVINNVPNFFNISNFIDSDYFWRVECFDNNTFAHSVSSTRNFTVDLVDPNVTLHSPANNSFFSTSDITFNYTPIDVHLEACVLYGNFSSSWIVEQIDSSPTNNAFNTFDETLPDGVFAWNVQCNDTAGRTNFSRFNYTINIDTTPPNFSGNRTDPVSPTTYVQGQQYQFNITWTDNFGVDIVILEHNFTGTLQNVTVAPGGNNIYNFTIFDLPAGTYRYKWFANDSLSQDNETIQYTYLVNKATSVVNLTLNGTDGDIAITHPTDINSTGNLLTPTAGIIDIYLNDVLIQSGNTPQTNISRITTAGVHNVTVVYNTTQNYTRGEETHFITAEDDTPPLVRLVDPANNSIHTKSFTVTFTYNVTNPDTGVDSCELIIDTIVVATDTTITEGINQTIDHTLTNGNYNWSVNCTGFGAVGASETFNLTVNATSTGAKLVQPDAGAPGMQLAVQLVGEDFDATDAVTVNTTDIVVGPKIITNETGDVVENDGVVMTTTFFISKDAAAQDVEVSIRGEALQTIFTIAVPTAQSGNFTGASGTMLIGDGANGTRTTGGAIVLDSLIIPSGVTVEVNTTDLDGNANNGNQGFLPVYLVVRGPVNISGTLNVSGQRGDDGVVDDPGGAGGDGGPGGAGGGSAGLDGTESGVSQPDGGAGFTGGAGGTCENTPECTGGDGGVGTGSIGGTNSLNVGGTGGPALYSVTTAATSGDDNGEDVGPGSGGGTGWPFGSGGAGGNRGGSAGTGGGEGGNTVGAGGSGTGGGGGGHAVAGTDGVDGGAGDGAGGALYGSAPLLPLAGGSGGGGGGSEDANPTIGDSGGGGGGGGGALSIFSPVFIEVTGTITAAGGEGGLAGMSGGVLGGSGGGGGGGAIVLSSPNISVTGTLNARGGGGGSSAANNGGDGGLGRLRVDGLTDAASFGTSESGSNFTGIVLTQVNSTHVSGKATPSSDIEIVVQESGGEARFSGTTDAGGNYSVGVTLFVNLNYITAMQNTSANNVSVTSSAALSVYDNAPPNITLLAPANNSELAISMIEFVYNVTDYNLTTCTLYGNFSGSWEANQTNLTPTNNANNSFNVTLNDGIYIWNVQCNDTIGNVGFAANNFTLKIDTTPPNIVLNTPTNNSNQSSPVLFNWTANDNLAINVTCNFTVDGQLIESNIESANGEHVTRELNLTVLGVIEWNVTCVDELNNRNSSVIYEFFHLVPPVNFTADGNGTHVFLNWSAVAGADSYNLFISTNYSDKPSTANITGITDLNYTDNNTGQQIYYWIASVRGVTEAQRVQAVGKYRIETPFNLSLISFPLIPRETNLDNGTGGFKFISLPQCLASLWQWNGTAYERTDWNGTGFTPASGSEGFTELNMTYSYWFEANTTCNTTFVGAVPVNTTRVPLENGTNFVSWHTVLNQTLPTDSDPPLVVLSTNNTVQALDRYNPTTNQFEVTIHFDIAGVPWGWFPSFNNPDFTALDPTKGYSFDAVDAVNWTFDPLT